VTEILPSYIEARIKQRPLDAVPIVRGSTPVVAFGDARKAQVATLGWNPSKLEFLDHNGRELVDKERRLETLASVGEIDLVSASADAVSRIFGACNTYFQRRPYLWFRKLERVLKHVGASYYDGSACHLDLVQWATDPVWGKLSRSCQVQLLEADLPFLRNQLAQEKIRILLLNGNGIVSAYRRHLDGKLTESTIPGRTRLKFFAGRDTNGLRIIGWNINLQSSYGVSNDEIEVIGTVVKATVNSPTAERNP
jgi:hypothetical protein